MKFSLVFVVFAAYTSLLFGQPPNTNIINCTLSFADSFCMTCNYAGTSCLSCPTSYLFSDTTGFCSRSRVGDLSPSNMANNVRTFFNGTNEVIQTLDPYCVVDPQKNQNTSLGPECTSCTEYPSKTATSTSSPQGSSGPGGSTQQTKENPRYLGPDKLTCHSSCEYSSVGMVKNTNGYKCSNCASNCIKCSSNDFNACKECIYQKQRIQGSNVSINNFLTTANSSSGLNCATDRIDSTKNLVYYVAPAGSSPRCNSGCSNSDDGTGTLWDDLNKVFQDIIQNAANYTSIDVKIYLLKSGTNLYHYLLDQDSESGFYAYDYLTPTTQGHLPRPFERSLAKVYIGPIYCSSSSQTGCLADGEKPIIKWKSAMAHFSVTNEFVIENVIIDGADMTYDHFQNRNSYTCMKERKQCCSYSSTTKTTTAVQTPSSCNPSSVDYSQWSTDSSSYENKYKSEQLYGVFAFEFIRDKANAPIPSLTIKNCEIRNFLYSKYHTSFIQMCPLGGKLTIENTVFDRFFFPHGLISNAHTTVDRNLFGYSSFTGETCRSLQNLTNVNCHGITITSTNFTNYNPLKTTNLQTNDVHSIEGAVLAVHNLDGPITVRSCIFQSILAFQRYSTDNGGQYDCLNFSTSVWGPEPSNDEARHNIGSKSKYKIHLEKHFRRYAENKMANTSITAALHIRNVTKGLVIHSNTFDTIYTVVGGAVYIEGFNNTFNSPIIITSNTFTNNFAQFIGSNIFIYHKGFNLPRLNCSGIFVDSNTFTDNYGCLNTIGNVILACEPNNIDDYSSQADTGPTGFSSYYTKYAITSNDALESDTYAYRNFTRYLNERSAIKDIAYTYTHPINTSCTFNPSKVTFSNNIFRRNYMRLSNGLYIQGPLNLLIDSNTFESNSIPTQTTYSDSGFSSNAFKLTSKVTPSTSTSDTMVESVPLIVRQSNYITISNNLFNQNSQGFLGGDYYLAQAITMHQLIGRDGITLYNNKFYNHSGLTTTDISKGYFTFASSPLISFNFWEMTNEYIKGLDDNKDGVKEYPPVTTFSVKNCDIQNNVFNFNETADTKEYYYQKSGKMKNSYQNPFSHLLKYFAGEEVTGDVNSLSNPVSYNSGPVLIALHLDVTSTTIKNNTFNNGFCAFNSFWYDRLTLQSLTLQGNTIAQTSISSGGFLCAIKDSLFKGFNSGSTLVYSGITSTSDIGVLFYLTDIGSSDPTSTESYTINIRSVTIDGITSGITAPFTAISAKNIGINTFSATSYYGYYGLFYLSGISLLYANGVTATKGRGSDTGLIWANTAKNVEFHGITCSEITVNGTEDSNFSWETLAINQNLSVVNALVKQAEGNVTLVDSKLYSSSVSIAFLSTDGLLVFDGVEVYNLTVKYALTIGISSSKISFANSIIHNITAGTLASAGIVIIDSSEISTQNSSFYSISAPTNGFLLSQLSTISLNTTNVSYVTVTGDNAVIEAKLGSVTVLGSYFGYNTAGNQNIFSVTLATLLIVTSTFEHNTAVYMSNGLFIKKASGTANITSSKFIGQGESKYDSSSNIIAEFLVAYDTSISMDSVKFYDAAASYGAMYVDAEAYSVTLNLLEATNNYAENGVISAISKLVVTNSVFDGNTNSIYAESKEVEIINTSFSQGNAQAVNIPCTNTEAKITFNTVTFNGHPTRTLWNVSEDISSVKDRYGIILSGCSGISVANSVFKNLKYASGCGAGLYIYSESTSPSKFTFAISNTTFYNNIAKNGGSICVMNYGNGLSQATATDLVINSSRATSLGAGIYYDNFPTPKKSGNYKSSDGIDYFTLNGNSNIMNNVAGVGGAGIYYTQLRPTVSGLTFVNNSASYGPNWASYPVKITVVSNPSSSIYSDIVSSRLLQSTNPVSQDFLFEETETSSPNYRVLETSSSTITLQDFVSGQQLSPPLVIGLVDIDDQIVGNWDKSTLTMTFGDNSLKASTTVEFQASKGYFVLYPLVLSYTPGKQTNITLATTIDTTSSDILTNSETIQLNIEPYFRLCQVGERLTDANECELCAASKALFAVNSKEQCMDCPSNLNCYGGAVVGPQVVYSRFSKWNSRGVECLNDEACLGHTVTEAEAETLYCKEAYNKTFCLTGWCSSRYSGNLCAQCTTGNAKSSEIYCVSCSDNPLYYLLAVGVLILAIGFIVFTVRNALIVKDFSKIGGKPKTSILIKIFLNYVQLVSIVSSFDFRWPDEVKSMFTVQSKVSSSTSEVFSVDCFLPKSDNPNVRPFFLKLLFISVSPLILIIVSGLVWFIIFKRDKVFNFQKYKSNLTTTCVILLFMIHTTLVQTSILGFRCQNIGDESGDYMEYYLERDLEVKCWEGLHLLWVFACALPAFILWGIGIPLFAFRLLRNNKVKHELAEFKTKYGFLYDGYKGEKYYWEFIILYRKVLMIFISVFMVTYGVQIQALSVLGVSFLSYVLHMRGSPFQEDDLNAMEKKALINATITLYCGIYYITNELPTWANYLLLAIIILFNAIFFISWFITLIKEYKKQFLKGKKPKVKESKSKEEPIAEGAPIIESPGLQPKQDDEEKQEEMNNSAELKIQESVDDSPSKAISPKNPRPSRVAAPIEIEQKIE